MEFTVCAGDDGKMGGGHRIASAQETGKLNGIRWRHLESRRISAPILKGCEWQPEAVRIALREEVDAVISLGYQSLSNLLVRIICRARGIPLIEWTQGVKREEYGTRWLIRKAYFQWADAFLLYGTFARDFFLRHGFQREQLFVVRNSLDHDAQKQIRERIRPAEKLACRQRFGAASPHQRLIFNAGRVEKGKRLDLLIQALVESSRRGKHISLVLIGDGNERPALEQQAEAAGIKDRIHFVGACYHEEETGLIISASDLCVVPGEVGLVAMHSLVYGTPILTCDNARGMHGPEVETIREGVTGGFFRDGDSTALSRKLEDMLFPAPVKSNMSQRCMEIIDSSYTPQYQEQVVVDAVNYVLPAPLRIPKFSSGQAD